MTEIQKARSFVKMRPGTVKAAATRSTRDDRRSVRRALRAGDFDRAELATRRSIAWEVS